MGDVFDRIAGRATAGAPPAARLTARQEPRFAEVAGRAADGPRGDGDYRDYGGDTFGETASGRAQLSPDERHRGTPGIERHHDGRPADGRPDRGGPLQDDAPVMSGVADARGPEPQHAEPARREGVRATPSAADAETGSTPPVAAVSPAQPVVEGLRAHPDLEHASASAGQTAERGLAVPPADLVPNLRRTTLAPKPSASRPSRADRRQLEAPLPPGPLRVRGRSSPDPAPAPGSEGRVVSADELLRDHLAPALVAQGTVSLRAAERLTARGLDAVEVPAGGDVHVHIGTVELRQPETLAPPSRAERASDRVDHADYLARQQRRWS